MKKFSKISSVFLIVLMVFSFSSCEKISDDAIVLSKKIKLLSAELSGTSVSLEWSKPYMHGFDAYVIMRYDEAPESFELELVQYCYYDAYGQIECFETYDLNNNIAVIENPNTLTFEDRDIPITNELYYRIVAIGDTVIASNVIKVDFADVEVINHFASDIVYQLSSDNLIFIEENNSDRTIYKYDLDKQEISDSVKYSTSYWSSSYDGMKLLDNGGAELLAVWNHETLRVYNANTLSLIGTQIFNNSVRGVTSNNSGYLFVTDGTYIYTVDATNISQVASKYEYDADYLFYYGNELLAIENYSYPDYHYYTISANGSLMESDYGYSSIDELSGAFNKSNGYLISNSGIVYDFDLNTQGGFAIDYYSSSNLFSCDHLNNYLLNTQYSNKKIDIFSMQSFGAATKSYNTLGWPITSFVNEQGKVIVVSSTEEYYAKSMIVEQF